VRDDLGGVDDLPAPRRRQPVRAQLPVDSGDRDSDRTGPGVQHARDRARRALIQRLDPQSAERDAHGRRAGDEDRKAKWTHGGIVAAGPDSPRTAF
jgi:hypothetical protein